MGIAHDSTSGRSLGDPHPQYALRGSGSLLSLFATFVPAADPAIGGAVPNTGVDMTVQIKSALQNCPVGATLFFQPGTYLLSSAVACTRQISIWAEGVVFDWGTTALAGPAFTYGIGDGSQNLTRSHVIGLTIRRTTTNWASVYTGDYIGLQVDSCIECTFDRILVDGFARGVRLIGTNAAGPGSSGCYLNTFHGLETRNCMHHVVLETTGASDFVNDNAFYDWRCQNDSALGTAADIAGVTDYRYGVELLRILWGVSAANQQNANRFIGCLLESTSSRPVKRKVRNDGAFTYFAACRYEGHRTRSFAVADAASSGADGAATFDGVATPAGSTRIGNDYTLTQHVFYTDVTVFSIPRCTVNLNGFTMTYNGVLTLDGMIDGGYDITIGNLDRLAGNFQENVFHYGYDLRDIVVNDRIEYLGDYLGDPRTNSRNHFYSEWGIEIVGGSGTAKPALKLAPGGSATETSLEVWNAGAVARKVALRAQGSSGGHGALSFYNPTSGAGTMTNEIWLHSSGLGVQAPIAIRHGLWVNNAQADGDTRISTVGDLDCVRVDANTNLVGVGIALPTHKFHVNGPTRLDGAQVWNRQTKAAAYPIVNTDFYIGITAAAVTVTLPAASTCAVGQVFIVADENNTGAHNLTCAGADTYTDTFTNKVIGVDAALSVMCVNNSATGKWKLI